MLNLPPGCSAEDLPRLADWVEASVITDGTEIAKSELIEELQSGGLELAASSLFAEDVEEFGSDDGEEVADALERLADDVLAECRRRATSLSTSYPFELSTDLVSLRSDFTFDSYAFLLFADLGHHYPELKDAVMPDSQSGRLLEKVVEASLKGIFGISQRFGWPREPGWPTPIDGRVERLGQALGIIPDSLIGKTDPADNDRTLDVVGILQLENPHDASLVVLVQCASGQNWKKKLGDPSIEAWNNLLLWRSALVRAVALPWRLGGRSNDWSYHRIHSLSNGAMVLDRPRLLAGAPDVHLDPLVRDDVRTWWHEARDAMPRTNPPSA